MRDCVLLAAGFSSRYGENKLLSLQNGEAMIKHALFLHARLPYRQRVLVTQRGYTEVQALAKEAGFIVAVNPEPSRGIASSIVCGMDALADAGLPPCAVVFAMGDQPYLTERSMRALFAMQETHPTAILALAEQGKRKNPVLFPADLIPEFFALTGDTGGSTVIRRHMERLVAVEASTPGELTDIDTK